MDYGYNDFGNLQFLGEVRNDHETPRDNVEIRIALIDEEGQELGNRTQFTSIGYLNPGEISPFNVTFFDEQDLPEVVPSSYMVEIQSDEWNPDTDSGTRNVDITSEPTQIFESGRFRLSGNVRSEFDEPMRYVEAGAVFYDANGTVVGLKSIYVETDVRDDVLPPGENGSFDLEIFESNLSAIPTSYRTFVERSRISE